MQETITILIITLGISGLALIDYLGNKKLDKIKAETDLRLSDIKLQRYYTEMNTERNDGWTKEHYKLLYEARIKELKEIKKKYKNK
jgi:hypothetical protein